eukprot:SAG11_NODE_586_length_8341_cov_33.741204_5_plen_116_part_00
MKCMWPRFGPTTGQVWRPEGNSVYGLVCEDAFNVIEEDRVKYVEIPVSQQCTVLAGDVIGLYHHGPGVIAFDDNTDNAGDSLLIRCVESHHCRIELAKQLKFLFALHIFCAADQM